MPPSLADSVPAHRGHAPGRPRRRTREGRRPQAARRSLEATIGAAREALERRLDAWNERLLMALQRDGSTYMSNAGVSGRFALRACVMNHRTTLADMDVLLADVRRIAATLGTF